jgi:hypothetical protein
VTIFSWRDSEFPLLLSPFSAPMVTYESGRTHAEPPGERREPLAAGRAALAPAARATAVDADAPLLVACTRLHTHPY